MSAARALPLAALLLAGAAARQPPNFLFILTDDEDVLLGGGLAVMPSVSEGIFAAGMRFDRAFTSSPICCPSRTSLFSGLYAHNLRDPELGWCGDATQHDELDDNFLLALARQGYAVGQFGKWFNQEAFFAPPFTPAWLNASASNDFFVMTDEVKYFNNTFNDNGQHFQAPPGAYLTSIIGNRSVDWLRRVTAGDSPRPWIAYIAPHAPHLPATPAPWYVDAPVPAQTAPRTPNWNAGWQDKHFIIDNGIDKPMSAELINGSDTLYRSRLRTLMSVDDLVREALATVAAAGPHTADNTVVLFSSDHGYKLGQFGVWSEKASPYDVDARVPLAISGPGIAAGSVTTALVTNIDLPATLLELAGAPNSWPVNPGQQRDGTSLVPLLTSAGGLPPAGWRDRLLIEFVGWITEFEWLTPCQFQLGPCGSGAAGLVNGASNNWVALRVQNASHDTLIAEWRPPLAPLRPSETNWTEAYDLGSDPYEMENLAVKGRLPPATLQAMRNELWALATCVAASCP